MTKFKNDMIFFNTTRKRNESCTCFESETHQYIKKPIPILAQQVGDHGYISTLEGIMEFSKGDYLVEGIDGEHYPVKQSIFEKTYVTKGDGNS